MRYGRNWCVGNYAFFPTFVRDTISELVFFETRVARFFATTYQNGKKCTKMGENIPNGHKICPMTG
jgi:hypothetical protein